MDLNIDDLDDEDDEMEANNSEEEKRKLKGGYSTFKEKQGAEVGNYQINILKNTTKRLVPEEKPEIINRGVNLKKKSTVNGEELSGGSGFDENGTDSNIPFKFDRVQRR